MHFYPLLLSTARQKPAAIFFFKRVKLFIKFRKVSQYLVKSILRNILYLCQKKGRDEKAMTC
jgi:hypothetical protein